MKVGDVIILPFFKHQENKQEGEARWAIVVEDLGSHYLIVPMTCQQSQSSRYVKTLAIPKLSNDGIQMGLTCDALVIGDRATEMPKTIFKFGITVKGSCPDEILDQIFSLTE